VKLRNSSAATRNSGDETKRAPDIGRRKRQGSVMTTPAVNEKMTIGAGETQRALLAGIILLTDTAVAAMVVDSVVECRAAGALAIVTR
jgi:hypothetical protein